MNPRTRSNDGQAMVEFALILLVLLFIIFVLIEGARILQANLTVQNAAREAARYAITGQFETDCLLETPPCTDPRVESIKAVAEEALAGMNLDPNAAYNEPNYYLIEVFGTDENGNLVPDNAGVPGEPVWVRVTYRVGIVTPIVQSVAETVRVFGQVVLNNEQFSQVSGTSGNDDPPDLPPLPTLGPSPTPAPPDLNVTKTDSPDPAIVNEALAYTIQVQNLGSIDATGVTLTDTLPAGVSVSNISPDQGTCTQAGSTITCDLGTLAAGGSTTVSIDVVPNSAGTITNAVTVSANETDPDTSNNTDTADTEVVDTPNDADLAISKSGSPNPVATGGSLVYTLAIINNGLADATGVTVTDTLPGTVTFVSATASQGSCGESGGVVTCNLGDLARDASANVSIEVTPNQLGIITNVAGVGANEPDPDPSNNTASVDTSVENTADMGITKAASANPGANELMQYTLSVVNNGPAGATGVLVEDSLPPSVNYVGATPSQGSCSESGNVVSCPLGDIANGAGATIVIDVVPTQDGVVTNVATVNANEADPYDPNDSYTLNTTIQPRTDLAITKSGPANVDAGDILTYTLNVTNNGPSDATGVTVNDTLPANVTFVSASASQGTCGHSQGTVTCSLGNMADGATAAVTIRIIPTQFQSGTITNVASVEGNQTDPTPANNEDSADVAVDANTFISLDPICGDPGDEVVVNGYNWLTDQSNQYDLYLEWLPDGNDPAEMLTITSSPSDNPFENDANWTKTALIPADASLGTHLIQARRFRQNPPTNQATETATFQVPCPAPNLEISDPVVVSPTNGIVEGDPVSVRVTISNTGDLDAISQFFVGLYFDPAPEPILGTSTHISQTFRENIVAINGLAVNASQAVTLTAENGFTMDGAHMIYTVVDSDPGPTGITDELDEMDNISGIQVSVEAGPDPTPTATTSITPTITPTPADPGGIAGQVYGQESLPQANVEVNVYDDSDSSLAGTQFTDVNGTYYFDTLQPGFYTVTGCINIGGTDYYDFVAGVEVTSGNVTQQNLFLNPSPAGCTG